MEKTHTTDKQNRDNKARYTLGLYEKALPNGMPFAQMLNSAAGSGFDRLEISIDESEERLSRLNWSEKQRAALRNTMHDSGTLIETMCLSGHRKYPLGSHDAAKRNRALDILRQAVDFSRDIGIRIIQLAGYDVYYESGDEYTRAKFLENLPECVEIAARAGILLGIETMETPFIDTVSKAMRYVALAKSAYLGVYPDIGNLKNASVLYHSDLLEDIDSGAGHFYAAHLKETVPNVYRNLTYGCGHTEYIPCIGRLWSHGVRIFTGEFWYLGEADYMRSLKNANAFLRQRIEAAIPD